MRCLPLSVRFTWLRSLVVFPLALACWGAEPPDPRELVRRSIERLQDSEDTQRNYEYLIHRDTKEFHSDGKSRKQSATVLRKEFDGQFIVVRLLERDGQPIPEAERRQNEETIRKRLAEFKAKPPEEIKKLRAENRRRSREEDSWLQEAHEALDFKPAVEETIHGRAARVLECSPRSGYQAKNMRARVFEKMRGRIWIDKTDSELVRADIEVFDTVSIAWGLVGKIGKGTKFFLQRRKVASDAWLLEAQTIKLDARFLLVKSMRTESSVRYSEFRHKGD